MLIRPTPGMTPPQVYQPEGYQPGPSIDSEIRIVQGVSTEPMIFPANSSDLMNEPYILPVVVGQGD